MTCGNGEYRWKFEPGFSRPVPRQMYGNYKPINLADTSVLLDYILENTSFRRKIL
jgi:hypothetical protein